MTVEHKITCDACGKDLTYTGNSVDYRLALISQAKGTYPGAHAVTDMLIAPPLERDKHFCRLECLDIWRDRERCGFVQVLT